MGRVVLTAPDPTIGAEFIEEARELLALGYQRPAAMMARLSIEAAVVRRLDPMGPRPRHKSFADAAKLFRRGCEGKSLSWTAVDRTYRRLSQFAHIECVADGESVPSLIELAATFRQLVATAEATNQAAATLEVQHG